MSDLLTEDAAAELQRSLHPGWERDGTALLTRRFSFGDFRDAFGFATRVALLAERQNHHPDFEIGWGRVVLALTSHSAGGLTADDFAVAGEIDRLAG
ncbi:MAG TPA: 4a-hydroxytetrahydrobiopterin dehydratase [Actinomycetota bacterium]|nr:4a-hydroxytetrahydrobiopterin dehydratase [Actinomycetota bacterium]